jgi:hypothetical protein
MPAQKGDPIRFVKGKYLGNVGWINTGKKKTKSGTYCYVIVRLENEEKETRVKRSSYRERQVPPKTYEEAILQQHPDIEGTH